VNVERVRALLLADAAARAERLRDTARAEAASALHGAEAEVDRLLAQARREGEELARRAADRELVEARREARRLVLEAQADAYAELRRRVRAHALTIRAQPGYRRWLSALSEAASRQLGPEAKLTVDVPQVGGVRAERDGRALDYTLPALAERCLEAAAGQSQELWR
jgi:vacuolar-type H+-ATPase subunit E/Vma4